MKGYRAELLSYGALLGYALLIAMATTLTISQLLPSFVQMIVLLAAFLLGYGSLQEVSVPHADAKVIVPGFALPVIGLTVLAAAVVNGQYYAGKLPAEVLAHLLDGRSLYASYQQHNTLLVESGGGGGYTVYFFLLVYIKIVMLTSIFGFIARRVPIGFSQIMLLASAIAAQAYLGLTRGTGLEFFELGTAIFFAMLIRPRGIAPRKRIWPILAIALTVGLLIFYDWVLKLRGVSQLSLEVGDDVRLDTATLPGLAQSGIGSVLLTFYDYFGFGAHYVSTFWSDLWLTSPSSAVLGLIPGSWAALGLDPRARMMDLLVMGTQWHPDSALAIMNFGFMGLLVSCWALGHLGKRLERGGSVESLILRYFVFVQMMAFPVGNFVWVDTANLVVIVLLGGWMILRWARGGVQSSARVERR